MEKKLREKIADYLDKAIEAKTETVFVPAAENEFQEHIAYGSLLNIADVIIPMVKEGLNAELSQLRSDLVAAREQSRELSDSARRLLNVIGFGFAQKEMFAKEYLQVDAALSKFIEKQ